MLRFIVDIIKDLLCQADISIHLMLRFIQMFLLSVQLFQPFQYISCYGLSLRILCTRDCCTSFQYISCYGLSKEKTTGKTALVISIHLMLRFIPRNYITLDQIRRISIHLMLRFISVHAAAHFLHS